MKYELLCVPFGGGLKETGCGVEGALWRRAWASAGALAVSDPGPPLIPSSPWTGGETEAQ